MAERCVWLNIFPFHLALALALLEISHNLLETLGLSQFTDSPDSLRQPSFLLSGSEEIDLESTEETLVGEPSSTPSSSTRQWLYIVGGVGLAIVLTAIIVAVVSSSVSEGRLNPRAPPKKPPTAPVPSMAQPSPPPLEPPSPPTLIPPTAPVATTLYRIQYGTESLQFGDLRVPNITGPLPLAIVIHGGYWYNSYGLDLMTDMCNTISSQGIATWNIEYRRMGDAGAGYPGTFQDVSQSIDFLRTIASNYSLDLAKVIVVGHSAGGHLALWAAGRENLNASSPIAPSDPLPLIGVVSLAGVSNLYECEGSSLCSSAVNNFLGGTSSLFPDKYREASPSILLPFAIPHHTLHGTNDGAVPFQMSVNFVNLAKSKGDNATLISLTGGHFELITPTSSQFAYVLTSIKRLLGVS